MDEKAVLRDFHRVHEIFLESTRRAGALLPILRLVYGSHLVSALNAHRLRPEIEPDYVFSFCRRG